MRTYRTYMQIAIYESNQIDIIKGSWQPVNNTAYFLNKTYFTF